MLNQFDFPGVELNQVFAEAQTTGTGTLYVACIGQQYKMHKADSESEAARITTPYNPVADITVNPLPGRNTDYTLDTDTSHQKLVVKDGVFAYFTANSAASFAPTYDIANCYISFPGAVVNGQGYTAHAKFGTRGAKVGDTVIIAGTGGPVTTTIVAIEFEAGKGYSKIKVASFGTITAAGSTPSVKFCATQDAVIGQSSTTFIISGAGSLTVKQGITAAVAGVPDAGALQSGSLYIEYRENMTDYIGKLGIIASRNDVQSILGTPCADNPLALSVYFALSTSNGVPVYFTCVSADTGAAYTTAMGVLEKNSDIYSIVPASETTAVILACKDAAEAISSDVNSKSRRIVWYGVTSTATTAAAIVSDVISKRCTNTYRARCVWADGAYFNGELLPNLALAAAAAGMRSGQPCHRPISNLSYSVFTLAEDHGLTRGNLLNIGANGIWIIANNREGTPVNMRQITTAVANDLREDEDSVVCNADEIALQLCRVGEDLVGCSNISPMLITLLSDSISAVMDYRMEDHTGTGYVGPQLSSWSLDKIAQSEVSLDHVYATITFTTVKPFNKFIITVRVV